MPLPILALRELPLSDWAVRRDAAVLEARDALFQSGLSAVAIVDDDRQVVGLFTEDDLLAALFPRYLRELRHTAFAGDDPSVLAAAADRAAADAVERHMRKPVTLAISSSATHAAEVFLHCEWGTLAVIEEGRFVGMLSQLDFCRALVRRLAAAS